MKTPSPALQSWLDHPTSITDRLKAYHADVQLTCLTQTWDTPDTWEQIHLPEKSIFRREILMSAGQHTCWYARTIIPLETYLLEASRFSRLETEPLGNIIWHASDIKRKTMLQFSLDETTSLYQHIQNLPLKLTEQCLWGRLSTFMIKQTLPFYLLEIFLPELQHYYE